MLTNTQLIKFGIVSALAISLAACESSGSYRLASVGSVPDGSSGGSSGGDGSSGGSSSSGGGTTSSSGGGSSSSSGGAGPLGGNLIVTAGNAVIGVAGKTNGLPQTLAPVTGTVSKILYKTGQTLVDIGNGNTLILGKAGGKVGDLLRIDIGSKTVIGAPNGSPLLGVGVLAPAGSGNILTATVGKTVGVVVDVTKPLTGSVTGSVTPQAGTTTPITGATGAVGGVVKGVTGVVGGILTPKK
jgi:hypothetical protein